MKYYSPKFTLFMLQKCNQVVNAANQLNKKKLIVQPRRNLTTGANKTVNLEIG